MTERVVVVRSLIAEEEDKREKVGTIRVGWKT